MDYLQQEQVIQFLMGLNDCFNKVKRQILLLNPLPPESCLLHSVTRGETKGDRTTSKFTIELLLKDRSLLLRDLMVQGLKTY